MDAHPALEKGVEPHERLTSDYPDDDEIESICCEMENVELTEEETTSLLNDALDLNKRLKEELRRQEREDREKRDGTRNRTGSGNKHRLAGEGLGRRGDAVSASLPPINPTRGMSVNQRRIYNSVETVGGRHNKTKNAQLVGAMQRKTHSADGGQRPLSSGHPRTRGTQSAESKQRPGWNDRNHQQRRTAYTLQDM